LFLGTYMTEEQRAKRDEDLLEFLVEGHKFFR
jgi:hypothetical protein